MTEQRCLCRNYMINELGWARIRPMEVIFYALLVSGLLSIGAGCASCPDCGSIRKRFEISQIFLNEEVVPDYSYYTFGENTNPRAILGIDNRYILEGRFWTPVENPQEQLSHWISRIRPMNTMSSAAYGTFNGFEILDPDGSRVGIWYSVFDWGSVRFPGVNIILISAPSLRPDAGSFSQNLMLQ